MNKTIAAYFFGVLCGGLAAAIATRDIFEKRASEEVYKMRERYIKKKIALENEIKKEKEQKNEAKKEARKNVSQSSIKDGDRKTDYTEYSKIVSPYIQKPEEPEDFEDESEEAYDEDYIPSHPTEGPLEDLYVITPQQFSDENMYFDKETLIYYKGDDVLATEDGEIEHLDLNFDILKEIGRYERDACYVRDDESGADYEILLNNGRYSDNY